MKKLFRKLTCGFCRKEDRAYSDFHPKYSGVMYFPKGSNSLLVDTNDGCQVLFTIVNYCPVCGRRIRFNTLPNP